MKEIIELSESEIRQAVYDYLLAARKIPKGCTAIVQLNFSQSLRSGEVAFIARITVDKKE